MKATQTFDDLLCDQFDIRDMIKRFEELETELQDAHHGESDPPASPFDEWAKNTAADENATMQDAAIEFRAIQSFLDDVKGYGGDEQWRGDWYPVGFIADSYFEQFAQELAEDIGAINRDASWPNTCIDWEQAARELQQDYSIVTINGSDYWYR